MKDKGINLGLIQDFNTSEKRLKGSMYGFRKMFWTYLKKLNVPFYDTCCTEASEGVDLQPVRFNNDLVITERFNGSGWVSVVANNGSILSLVANTITPSTGFLKVTKGTVQVPGLSSTENVTATLTSAEVVGGLITSTSAAAVSLTLPTTTDLTNIVGVAKGTTLEFSVENTGPNSVTLLVGTGMLALSAVTGGTNLVTTTGSIGQFRIYIVSSTVSKISRVF